MCVCLGGVRGSLERVLTRPEERTAFSWVLHVPWYPQPSKALPEIAASPRKNCPQWVLHVNREPIQISSLSLNHWMLKLSLTPTLYKIFRPYLIYAFNVPSCSFIFVRFTPNQYDWLKTISSRGQRHMEFCLSPAWWPTGHNKMMNKKCLTKIKLCIILGVERERRKEEPPCFPSLLKPTYTHSYPSRKKQCLRSGGSTGDEQTPQAPLPPCSWRGVPQGQWYTYHPCFNP